MKKLPALIIALCVVLMTWTLTLSTYEASAGSPLMQKDLYVDDDPGSTYDNIRDALTFALPGDTIVVAPGTYYENIDLSMNDITISGNITDGEVKVVGGSGIALLIHDCMHVAVYGINFTSTGNNAVRIERTNNITINGCTAWSTGGTFGAMSIFESQHIYIGPIQSFTPFVPTFHAEGNSNPGLFLENVQNLHGTSLNVFTWGPQAHCVQSVAMLFYSSITPDHFEARGPSSNTFDLQGPTELLLEDFIYPTYSKNFIELGSGVVETMRSRFNEGDVWVGPTASIFAWMQREIFMRNEDNSSAVENCEIQVTVDGADHYSTPYFGGMDPLSDTGGGFPDKFVLLKIKYIGSSTPIPIVNLLDFRFEGGDVPVEGSVEIDPVPFDPMYFQLPDFTLPEAPRNLRADTIDHRTIEVVFEPSTSPDVTHYEVWFKSLDEWEWQFNTSNAGSYPFINLDPATEYGFRVVAVDDAGLTNASEVYGTTGPPIEGDLRGNVTYNGGPLNGTHAINAEVQLLNGTGGLVGSRIVSTEGLFVYDPLLFAENYTLVITPVDPVEPWGDASGYLNWSYNFDFTEPVNLVIFIEYFEYIPPVTTGTLEGQVTYLNGPMVGMNSTNATVFLFDEDGAEFGNATTNLTGHFMFEGVPFADNYTLKIVPEDAVVSGGQVSGYIERTILFNFNASMLLPIALEYYTYTPPSGGPIYGLVLYSGGPMDGDPVVMAKVEVLSNGGSFAYVNTNSTGHYRLSSIGFGTNYTLRITPPADQLGVVDNNSGYLVKLSDAFDHSDPAGRQMDLDLEYYEYIPEEPPVEHPKVTILDENGDPVPNVLVTVTINGTTYTAITDENGTAEFTQLTGSDFPSGAHFKASKEGYEDIEWDQGDPIPDLVKEKEDKDEPNLLTVVIILVIVLLLLGIVVLLLKRRSEYEEE
ncbi:MAG: fibronectin type III domain-containing protein [Thermoplasmatota archaeon]